MCLSSSSVCPEEEQQNSDLLYYGGIEDSLQEVCFFLPLVCWDHVKGGGWQSKFQTVPAVPGAEIIRDKEGKSMRVSMI